MSDACNKTRCSVCLGKKFIEGIGYMRKKCDNCEGVGFLFRVLVDDPDETVKKVEEVVPPKKKRGRPPKVKVDMDK